MRAMKPENNHGRLLSMILYDKYISYVRMVKSLRYLGMIGYPNDLIFRRDRGVSLPFKLPIIRYLR